MTDGTFGHLGHLVSAVGTRRSTLAALLATAAGVQTAEQPAKGAGKRRRGKKGKKGKNTNQRGAGDTPLPHVTYAIRQRAIPNQTGAINISATCPTGSVPIDGVWTVENVHDSSLINQFIVLTQPAAWEVNVAVPTGSPRAIIQLIAICLDATFTVDEEE